MKSVQKWTTKEKRSLKGAGKTWESYNLTYCHPGSMMAYPSNYLETHCQAHRELNPSKLSDSGVKCAQAEKNSRPQTFLKHELKWKNCISLSESHVWKNSVESSEISKNKSSQFNLIQVPASTGATCGLLRILRCRSKKSPCAMPEVLIGQVHTYCKRMKIAGNIIWPYFTWMDNLHDLRMP